jgi:arylsulfatase A-like enzyme
MRIPAAVLPLLVWFGLPPPSGAAARPNVVVILADDMGFSDPGCYGGEIQTPHLDRLAAEGLRFSQFYNCALCGPSRAALMTGLHPHQAGITQWTGLLRANGATLFELLKRAGYQTCAAGRLDMLTAENWHDPAALGRHADRFFGTTGHQGPGNYFANTRNTAFFRDGEAFTMPEGSYKTDLITDFTVAFLRERDRERPFLLYLSHYAPHWPLHAKPEDIAKYRALYRDLGWDGVRERRMKGLVEKGILPEGTRLSAREARAAAWAEAKHADWEAERMAVYAAQIDALDQSVGRVIEALRETGAERETLVFFLSDNGASDKAVGPLDKPGRTWRADGVRTRVGNRPEIMPGPGDTFVTAGPAWSNAANTPFRHHKQSNHEGGIASPLIVWGAGLVARPGGVSGELSHITDIPATVLEAAGVAYPAEFDGRRLAAPAGKSLLPVLGGGERAGHETLCWATSGCKAVRQGKWKLVALAGGPWELYDLSRDRTELDDLAEAQPERVAAMARVFEEWRAK